MYLATGMTPLGKTQMSEYGFSASAEHPRLGSVRNPWNTDHTAGASSSGSGAFVAAGVVPIAHANDGGGSIRIPASCNGLVGLKPSRGRLPLDKEVSQMPIRIVANGVLSRSVRDTAAFYREAERIWPAPKLPPIGDVKHAGTQRLRVAVVTHSLLRECSPELRELTLKSAGLLEELGHRVDHLEKPPVPDSFASDFVLYWGLLAMGQIQQNRRAIDGFDVSRLDNLSRGLDRHARRNLHRIPLALVRLARARRHTARLARTYDLVLTPTLADEPPQIGYLDPTADYRADHRPLGGVGRLHPAAERHRGARYLVAAGDVRQRLAGGDDVLRADGTGSPVAGTWLTNSKTPSRGRVSTTSSRDASAASIRLNSRCSAADSLANTRASASRTADSARLNSADLRR